MKKDVKGQTLPQLNKGLWVVATPIGCLSDLSPRAREALCQADVILCEDTRRTRELLSFLGFSKQLERFDRFTTPSQMEKFLKWLKEGQSLALVTDAGTPGVSDPASKLVALAHEQGYPVVPLPGPSALSTLVSISGFVEGGFEFLGFFPRTASEQKESVSQLRNHTTCSHFFFFESPKRILKTLEVLKESLQDLDPLAVVAKELTKVYEKIFWGKLSNVFERIREEIENEGEKGEWCFGLSLSPQTQSKEADGSDSSKSWKTALECLVEVGAGGSESARCVSRKFNVSRNEVYAEFLRMQQAASKKP